MGIRGLLFFCLALAVMAMTGCGPPAVAPGNRELVGSLRTAVSAKNTEWLEANAKLVDERREKGELSDAELAEFSTIIQAARAGDWAAAQKQVIALEKAFRPTPEELERAKNRQR